MAKMTSSDIESDMMRTKATHEADEEESDKLFHFGLEKFGGKGEIGAKALSEVLQFLVYIHNNHVPELANVGDKYLLAFFEDATFRKAVGLYECSLEALFHVSQMARFRRDFAVLEALDTVHRKSVHLLDSATIHNFGVVVQFESGQGVMAKLLKHGRRFILNPLTQEFFGKIAPIVVTYLCQSSVPPPLDHRLGIESKL